MSKISLDKTSWELVEVLKETTKKNLLSAIKDKQLNVDQEVLPKLFTLLDSSMSEGYNKSYKNFSTKFEKISEQIVESKSDTTEKEASSKKRK